MHTALDNSLNRGNINEILTWFMPRYSAGVEKSTTSGEKWIAPKNGWVVGRCQLPNNLTTYHFYVNDVIVANLMAYECSVEETVIFPVTAGDEVYTNVPDGGFIKAVTFYPCKGVSTEPPQANFTVTGDVTITDGVASNFSNANYITADYTFNPSASSFWTFETAILFTQIDYNNQYFVSTDSPKSFMLGKETYIDAAISGDGSDWHHFPAVEDVNPTTNVKYYVKLTFDGSNTYTLSVSTDKITWYSATSTGAQVVTGSKFVLGTAGYSNLRGNLYLNDTKLTVDGNVVWQPYS